MIIFVNNVFYQVAMYDITRSIQESLYAICFVLLGTARLFLTIITVGLLTLSRRTEGLWTVSVLPWYLQVNAPARIKKLKMKSQLNILNKFVYQ